MKRKYKEPLMKPVELKSACLMAGSPEPAAQSIDTYTESEETGWSIN